MDYPGALCKKHFESAMVQRPTSSICDKYFMLFRKLLIVFQAVELVSNGLFEEIVSNSFLPYCVVLTEETCKGTEI